MHKHVLQRLLIASLAASLAGVCSVQAHSAPAAAPSSGQARASMEVMQIPSHGALMNGLVYVAAGEGPHPAVILLHGLPGYERNLDLAQDIRRAGWDVLYFDYRGSWGTPGDFSFGHGIEDTTAALAYLREPAVAKQLRLDPAHIVLIGHSMGGFMVVQAAAADPGVEAIGIISGADLGAGYLGLQRDNTDPVAQRKLAAVLGGQGMAPLAGCTPKGLASEVAAHATQWAFPARARGLKDRAVLVVTSDDGFAGMGDAFVNALQHAGATQVTTLHLATDHAYSDKRIELSQAVLAWLSRLPR
jgi:pimeloyl-ACP methyl ester carboxylesterase